MYRAKSIAIILAFYLASAAAVAGDLTHTWQRWEQRLTSNRDYVNPCADVQVKVRIDGPDGQHDEGLGFWDGGRQFTIRYAFPAPGEWKWKTTCSDTANGGLHGRSGTVRVTRADSRNLLNRHGYPRVGDGGRFLTYADGTPFLWIGDTCWRAPSHASDMEWAQYVANRAAKGYSVLQLSIASDRALEHSRLGIAPFLSKLPDITKPNPAYFQAMDRRIGEANDHGLVVVMVGLMETPYRYPPPEQIAILSRYVAARYASQAVIFSPSFDSPIHVAETEAAVRAIREAAPANLITMHMGTGVGPRFHAAGWLSFDMYQSGHNGGDKARQSARAIGMAAEILALARRKPLVNGETIYEGDLGGAYDVRRTGWLSFLSGAKGYTAGINEVYKWDINVLAMMNAPSSDQVALLGRILGALPWWDLEPAPQRILNQPDDNARLMAFALTADKTLGIAYLPANKAIDLDLSGGSPVYDILWVNPATGNWRVGVPTGAGPKSTLNAPDAKDWVLLLAAPGSGAPGKLREILAGVPAKQKTVAMLNIGPNAPIDGLLWKPLADGRFVRSSFEGVDCLINEDPGRDQYLYCDLDDRLAFRGGPSRMRVKVRLQSNGSLDGIALQYDAPGKAEAANVFRSVAPSSRRQAGRWTEMIFDIESPYLGNRQQNCADFRLFLNGQTCRITSIELTLNDGAK
ncbi:MAG: DUF4038 domain-containing protein [bacterium]|nr:DUF4038 domain-containing protein [bacterium]